MNTKDLTNEIASRENFNRMVSFWKMLPDPDPILRKIGKDISTYRELITDSHLFSVIQQRKAGVLSLEKELQRMDSNENEFNFINSIFDNINLDNLFNQILNTPLFGFTVFEIVWEKQGNFLIPARIEDKPQEWFFFDQANQLNLKKSFNDIRMEGIPINPLKFLIVQHNPTYINPYGERLLSRCFWPIAFKRGGLKFWATFTEKYGMPFSVGKLPRGSSQEQIDSLLDKLTVMILDAVAVIPDDASIEFLEAEKATSADIYEKFLNFNNSEISKAILTQTLTTEVQDKGTYAASSTMADMLQQLNLTDKKIIEQTINKLINIIYTINFNSQNKPKFILYKPKDVNLQLAQRDQILTNSGVKFNKNYYVKNYNLSEDDFEIGNPLQTNFAEPEKTATDDILEQIPDKLLQSQVEGALKPVLDMIKNDEDYNSITEKLAELYPKMKTEQLENLLSKLIFISEIEGMNS